jgi:hypothetical protein
MRVWLLLAALVGCVSWIARSELAAVADDVGDSAASARSDFNGDGFADLALGAGATQVHVLYGSPAGLSVAGNQLWSQDSPGIKGTAGFGDGFGSSLAAGDFNGDGFGDLAVGVEGETEIRLWGGAVNVIYGSAAGLTAAGNQFWHQNSPGIVGSVGDEDHFGWSLAAANFGKSSHDDLVIGVVGEATGGQSFAGAIQVLYGSSGGLTSAGNKLLTQNSTGIASQAEDSDSFGDSLAAGDFGKSAYADVAVGTPGEDIGNLPDAGVVHVLFGSAAGLKSSGSQMWSQNSRGVPEVAEEGEAFGFALAAADFGRDGRADLAVGVPGESRSGKGVVGGVTMLYGSRTGVTAAGSQLWSQASAGIKGAAETADGFGSALAAGDLGNSVHADLVVGVPEESVGDVPSGAVNVIYGSATGLTSAGNQHLSQGTPGIEGGLSEHAGFGYRVAVGNFGNSEPADLAIGAPNPTSQGDLPGVVHAVYGSATGLTPTGNQLWSRDTPGILGHSTGLFGWSLASST